MLDAFRDEPDPLEAVRALVRSMVRSAYGLDAPPVGRGRDRSICALIEPSTICWTSFAPGSTSAAPSPVKSSTARSTGPRSGSPAATSRAASRSPTSSALERGEPRSSSCSGSRRGASPAASRGRPSSPTRSAARSTRHPAARGSTRPEAVSRERYFFYTACTRPSRRLYLVREAATDDGSPREPSPFWDEARALFEPNDVARWTRRRPLAELTWRIEAAPTERERLRALTALASRDEDEAHALAYANGWDRRLVRALGAFSRPTQLTDPVLIEELRARETFSVTELEAFADCSSIWFIERLIRPRTIDGEVDARLRGSVAHQALFKFYSGLPKRTGGERVDPERLDETLEFLRECLSEAIEGGVWIEISDLQRRELEESMWRDLENFVREEAESPLGLVPRKFEVAFGSDRSAPELQSGLRVDGFALTGKIDRIDVDPFSARGIVQDYKSGKTAFSAAKIESELRLQIPLYMLVLRDLVGMEPLGGLYRALAGERRARGLLRAEAEEDVPGFSKRDYLEEDEFWAQTERAKEHATRFVERIRSGDVQHDPKGGFPCPTWCDLWSMCRVART